MGITRRDYNRNIIGNILSEEEAAGKTWIFLDENRITWGLYDEDLANKKSRDKIMKWSYALRKNTEEYFTKFYSFGESKNVQRTSR